MGKLDIVLGVSSVALMAFSLNFFIQRNIIYGLIFLSPSLVLGVLAIAYRRSRKIGKLDRKLVIAIIHMYAVSLGNVRSLDIIDVVASSPEYGAYSMVFRTVLDLAVNFGHGLSKALAQIANTVKPPLKDVLIRMTEAFSTTTPRDFLELETSTIIEEYSGYYVRALDSLKMIGGIFSTFQSVTVLIVLTMSIFTIFSGSTDMILFSYAIAAASISFLVAAFKVIVPKEEVVYFGVGGSRSYKLFLLSLLSIPLSIALFLLLMITSNIDLSLAILFLGLGSLPPGILAYRFERSVLHIDSYYPSFIKTLGENLESTLNLKSALEYVSYVHLGPLEKIVRKALIWLKLGLSCRKSLELMSSESQSYLIHVFNKILSDSLDSGSSPLKVSKILSNAVIKFLDFRKRRLSASKGIEAAILVLQAISVFILVTVSDLLGFFTGMAVPSTYFPFYSVPVSLIGLGNIALVILTSIANALVINISRGGFWGSFLLHLSILLIIGWSSMWASDIVIGYLISQFKFDILM